MPTKIKILPQELVNKIAAGEVIERPVSVVKELVENSIDAEATDVSIEIKSGGLKYIRVVDNGCGMDKEDVELAFVHHATSKLSSFDELNRILTLGFRGEALPSIALVSQVEVITKSRDALQCVSTKAQGISQSEWIHNGYTPTGGIQIKVDGGQIKSIKEVGAPEGTSITVREIFYNTPARRKFLKSQSAETKQIIDRVTTFALAFPQISFKLKVDNREIINLKKADELKERIGDIFGSQIYNEILELNTDYDFLQIKGFLGKPELARPNRAELYIFVNQRNIFSKSLYHAIVSGYKDLLPKGKYPWGVICLNLPPDLVDINVHPTKKEVRFSDEKQVYELLFSAVYKTLNTGLVMPVYSDIKENIVTSDEVGAYSDTPLQIKEGSPEYITKKDKIKSIQQEFLAEVYKGMKVSPLKEKKPEETPSVTANLWQLHNMYILTQVKGDLIVMDQHAAHERILYETALRNLTTESASSQHLLFPIVTELSPSEFMTFEENSDLIKKLGFEVKPFGGKSVLISGVPPLSKIQSGEVFLKEILIDIDERLKAGGDRVKSIAQSFACKGAIKAGDKLYLEEMNSLFDQLFATKEPYSCPHGRPTLIRIPIEEFNKRFERM
ncbi:MAG: DNA mismatch repair endonuclease MutL [candidate division Zixibacteria bacterium]|nr:DNA mismatch repair endonuclease MutL [candidate division Zixibacteria bacterium]